MAYAIKAEVVDPPARTFTFTAHKTMYGGKLIAEGDAVFVFASETQGGHGLIARGIVTHAEAIPKKRGIARQTLRVSVTIKRTALAKRPFGRRELKHLTDWNDGSRELNSISNSIGNQLTKSSASPVEQRRSSASVSNTIQTGVRFEFGPLK